MDNAALLGAIADGGATGSELASRFGMSRTMIWKGVSALRAEGNLIEGVPGEGYRLADGAGFGAATLSWRCNRNVHFFRRCGSTNTEAHRLAMADPGRAKGLLIVADAQTEGRGRMGRTWTSEPGANLLFSLVLCPRLVPQRAASGVLGWAAAMAEVLDLQLKWPNDLVTSSGEKVGGLLAQLQAEGDAVQFVVLGVGINVNQVDFPGLSQASSLAQIQGESTDRGSLLAALVRAVEAVGTDGTVDLEPWRRRAHTLGKAVQVGDVRGIATGLREDGALMVGDTPVMAGDVSLITDGSWTKPGPQR